jgi:hypothetical protein
MASRTQRREKEKRKNSLDIHETNESWINSPQSPPNTTKTCTGIYAGAKVEGREV